MFQSPDSLGKVLSTVHPVQSLKLLRLATAPMLRKSPALDIGDVGSSPISDPNEVSGLGHAT